MRIAECARRLRVLEERRGSTDEAFLTVKLRDGSLSRMLWVQAIRDSDNVLEVKSEGALADLVRELI